MINEYRRLTDPKLDLVNMPRPPSAGRAGFLTPLWPVGTLASFEVLADGNVGE